MGLKIQLWLLLIIVGTEFYVEGLSNWTKNDPDPLFSSIYPYAFLSQRQIIRLQNYDYTYRVDRARLSISGYRQSADRGRTLECNVETLGDLQNGRFNMLGLFYDPALRNQLYPVLSIENTLNCNNAALGEPGCCLNDAATTGNNCCSEVLFPDVSSICHCLDNIQEPRKIDPRREFGFFSVPTLYRKEGIRLEGEVLLLNRCYYAVGLRFQTGFADIRQEVTRWNDLTYQALGVVAPAYSQTGQTGTDTSPLPAEVTGVVPPYVDPYSVPPCNPEGIGNCIPSAQQFQPLMDSIEAFSFSRECKRLVIEKIMKQKDKIAKALDLDFCSYHHRGMEDLRLELYWRHSFSINEEALAYPRLYFTPFAKTGVGIPLDKPVPTNEVFALPIGNNGHVSAGASCGFTLNYLDTIDLTFKAGFTHFFSRDYCKFRLPTDPKESGIFPYAADVKMRPGTTWDFGISLNSYHFIGNLSVWAEYLFVNHQKNRLKICKSYIPKTSKYYDCGFLEDLYECRSEWQSQMVNLAFNYDLSPNLILGALFQLPVRQRNSYHATTVLGTLSFVY